MKPIQIADGITPELNRIAREIGKPRQLMAGCGKQMEIELRKHFAARDREGNAMGWPSKHFWRREVSMQTALTEVTDKSATVTIASPAFAHKVFGGTITPKRAKALTIPRTAQAYAAGSASLFPGKLIAIAGRLIDEAGTIQYRLAKSAHQDPDPKAWPEPAVMEAGILGRARAILARVVAARKR